MRARMKTAVRGACLLLLGGCEGRWTAMGSAEAGFVVEMPVGASCFGWSKPTSQGPLKGRACEVEVHRIAAGLQHANYRVSWSDRIPGAEEAVEHELARSDGFEPGPPREAPEPQLPSMAEQELAKKFPRHDLMKVTTQSTRLGGVDAVVYEIRPSTDGILGRTLRCFTRNRLYELDSVSFGSEEPTDPVWARMVDSFHFESPGPNVWKISRADGLSVEKGNGPAVRPGGMTHEELGRARER